MNFRPVPKGAIEKMREELVNINLLLTRRCNFGCKHCMYSAGPNLSSDYMGWEDLNLIHSFINHLRDEHDIAVSDVNMVGGEPTLDLDKFSDICDIVEDWGVSLDMTTNGWWIREWTTVNKFARSVWRLVENDNLTIRISHSDFHLPFRKSEKRLMDTKRLRDALECPYDHWCEEPQCHCGGTFRDEKVDGEYGYTCEKCGDRLSEDEYCELRDRPFVDGAFADYLVKAIDQEKMYVDQQGCDSEKLSPVGRARRIPAFQDGLCDSVSDVKFTFAPGGALFDPCCNGGHVPLGHASDPEQLFRARYWFMKALHEAYPKRESDTYLRNPLRGERCRQCPSFGAKWISSQESTKKPKFAKAA